MESELCLEFHGGCRGYGVPSSRPPEKVPMYIPHHLRSGYTRCLRSEVGRRQVFRGRKRTTVVQGDEERVEGGEVMMAFNPEVALS